MLIDARLSDTYWGEAAVTAVYLQNRLSIWEREVTLYEWLYKRKPILDHLEEFGCKAFAHIIKQNRNKLKDKAVKYVFKSYSSDSKAYRLLETPSRKIITSRDVRFVQGTRDEGEGSETAVSRLESKNVPATKTEKIVYFPCNNWVNPIVAETQKKY